MYIEIWIFFNIWRFYIKKNDLINKYGPTEGKAKGDKEKLLMIFAKKDLTFFKTSNFDYF